MARRRVAWNGGGTGGGVGCCSWAVERCQLKKGRGERGEGREVRIGVGVGSSWSGWIAGGGFSWAARVGCCWVRRLRQAQDRLRQAQGRLSEDAGMTGIGAGAERGCGWRVLAVLAMQTIQAMQSVQALIALLARLAGIPPSSAGPPRLDTLVRATSMGAEDYAGRMGGPWRCMLLVGTLWLCGRGMSGCPLAGARTIERLTS